MSYVLKVLGSSSSGNSYFLKTENASILIDAGFSAKQIFAKLATLNINPEDIDAVFISHEHSDHATGIRGIARKLEVPIFANRATAEAVQRKITSKANWNIFETGKRFYFQDINITTFSIPHDAYDPVGFTFEWGGRDLFSPRQKLAVLTDLGYVPENAIEQIKDADILIFESNYDEHLLDADDKRPWVTKQRIRSRHGHLSNENAARVLGSIENPRWKHLILSHLSKDCNSIECVRNAFDSFLTKMNHLKFSIIDPVNGSAIIKPS